MPSCLTKSFAAFLCRRARLHNRRPRARPAASRKAPTAAETKTRTVATKHASRDGRHPRPRRNARAKQPSSARQHAGPRQKNDAASAAHPTIAPTRRIVHRATDTLLHAVLSVVLFLVLVPAIARAHSAAALQQFDSGKQAFAAQDYAAALNAFEGAVAAGMSGPAVHFNIGVSAYKLSRWERAETAFREVARTPEMAALAH